MGHVYTDPHIPSINRPCESVVGGDPLASCGCASLVTNQLVQSLLLFWSSWMECARLVTTSVFQSNNAISINFPRCAGVLFQDANMEQCISIYVHVHWPQDLNNWNRTINKSEILGWFRCLLFSSFYMNAHGKCQLAFLEIISKNYGLEYKTGPLFTDPVQAT